MTDQRDLIEQMAETEAKARSQRELVSSALHDLRTPLVAIRGYARLLLGEDVGSVNEPQREYLAVILENAERMTSLLNDVSRSLAQQPLELELLDLVELWREVFHLLRPQLRLKSITFVEQLPDEPLNIRGDRDKLVLVLHRLLLNTIRHVGSVSRVEVRILPDNDQACLRVCETTDRMPPEFEDRAAGGVQASLEELASRRTLVHDIVRMHGGTVSINSGLGERWSFALTLPALLGEGISGVP